MGDSKYSNGFILFETSDPKLFIFCEEFDDSEVSSLNESLEECQYSEDFISLHVRLIFESKDYQKEEQCYERLAYGFILNYIAKGKWKIETGP